MKNYLFVYGTLANEYAPPEIAETVKHLKYIGEGFVFGRLYDVGEYPAAILDDSKQTKIFGRIYQLPTEPNVLQKLDDYEEFYSLDSPQNLFVRKRTTVFSKSGNKLIGWIYEYNKKVKPSSLIKSGDYSEIAA